MSDYKELIDKLRITGMTEGYCEILLNAADAIEQLVNDRNASVDALKALGANIDAVPVVRCKDCRYCDPENKHCDHPMGTLAPFPRKDDDFCSYGKRKGGDE